MNELRKASSSAPHVLALVTDAFGGYGGIAQYNRDFVSALAANGSCVDVLPRLAPGACEPMADSIHQHPAINGRLRYALAALRLTLRLKPDVIFNGHVYHGPLAQRLAQMIGAKLVSQLHGTEVWGPLSKRHAAPLEASDLVLTVSRDTRARILTKTEIYPERAVVLNNTFGSDFTPGDRTQARARFNITDEFVVLTVARLDAREGYKGHDRIIPLVARARAAGKSVCYLIAGIGDDEARLRALSTTLGVAECVRFLGKVPRQDLPDLYRGADLFALPSTGEGFGISFLEAMACGTPAIGLAVGGAPDALGDGYLGLCVSEEELEGAFLKCLETRERSPLIPAAVKDRFGFDAFRLQCDRLMALAC